MTKVCYRCKIEQSAELFRKNSRNPDGLHSWCTPCFAKYERDRWVNGDKVRKEANRAKSVEKSKAYVWAVLTSSSCLDCGNADPMVLEFDHRDASLKEYNVSEMFYLSIAKIQKEIDKCDIRCANCHRKRTAIQFGTWRTLQDVGVV